MNGPDGTTPADDLAFTPSPVSVKDLKKLGEGRQAELFAWPSANVVKLFRSPNDIAVARHEASVMRLLQPTGIPMPQFVGAVTVEQRPGIVMERLVGPDQLALVGRKPWTVWRVAKNLARLHVQLHATVAPEGLRSFGPTIRAEIERSDWVPSELKTLVFAELEHFTDGAAICHWDFHPGNVIETADGPKVIDWANVRRGDGLADLARTLLIIRGGALPPQTPFLRRQLMAVGRSLLGWQYLREYRRLRPLSDRDLRAWSLVNLVSRLSYGIGEERNSLLERIARERQSRPQF